MVCDRALHSMSQINVHEMPTYSRRAELEPPAKWRFDQVRRASGFDGLNLLKSRFAGLL
jgi:hypothetical protein